MIGCTKSFVQIKALVIAVITVLLAACTAPETSTVPTDSATPPSSLASSSSPEPTSSNSATSLVIPGANDVSEISFKAAPDDSSGFFDTVNNSTASRIEVPKATPVTVTGWAVLSNNKLPDRVIITAGDNNSVVAVTPVTLKRLDVSKALKNPAYENSGWSVTFNSSALPAEPVVLKAWAYNSANKEATQVPPTHEVVVLN